MELILIIIIGILGAKLVQKERHNSSNYTRNKRRNNSSSGKKPNYHSSYQNSQSEWRWDEDRQLWVHPDSEKNTVGSKAQNSQDQANSAGTSYNFKKSDIIQDDVIIGREEPAHTNTQEVNYSNCYQARLLLTKYEYQEFRKLRKYASERNLHICPKVRLLDIIEPRKGSGYMSYLGKIMSKHVDFVITDLDLHIKAIIELDDNSHDRPDRVERDIFVDQILTSVGYKVIHTKYITEETLNGL